MAIDARAIVTCSLGTLISGNIADSYIQGAGLVRTQGAIELSGLLSPSLGTPVTFSYKVNGGTRNIPRKLRVLSSFADPLRNTTRVQLGCKLTYLADKRDKINWTAVNDPENAANFNEDDYKIVVVPIRASSVMSKCLAELGITASSNPLTNRFSVAKFDYSPGYVSILDELLVSEGYCGYLNRNEVLQIIELAEVGGTGPLITKDQIIDLADINAGQLPGDAVTVSYSSLVLKLDNTPPVDWTKSQSSNQSTVPISYTDPTTGDQETKIYSTLDTTEELTDYTEFVRASTEETLNLVTYRKTTKTQSAASVLGTVMSQYLSNGYGLPNSQLTTITEEWYFYDAECNTIRELKETYADIGYAWGSVSMPMVFTVIIGAGSVNPYAVKDFVSVAGGRYLQESVETERTRFGVMEKVITRTYGAWMKTLSGQQAIAEARDSFQTRAQVENFMARLVAGKHLISQEVFTQDTTTSYQRAPSKADQLGQGYAKNGNPANNNRTESKQQLVLALGSPTAERRVEFTLPRAPDDYFYKTGPTTYGSVPSSARVKAINYGRIQNRLLLGNRNGMNLRLAATVMPAAPFSPMYVRAQGLTGMYRTNGTTWTFSDEGIVASTDALFWGGVGGSGSYYWFPVAPGITSLPSTPTTVTVNIEGTDDDGNTVVVGTQDQLTTDVVVAPYNETVALAPTTRTRLVVTSYPYSLAAVTTSASLTTKAKLTVTGLYPKELALTTKAKLVVTVPAVRVSGTAAPVLGAGQVSPTSTATNAGWTLAYNSTDDEGKTAIDLPFAVTIDGNARTTVYITSNSYAVFANNNVVYQNLGPSIPGGDKIHIGADDFSYQRVYTKSEANVYRIRWEGNSDYAAAAGNSNRFFELNFYKPIGTNQLVEIRSGDISGGTSGPFMLCNSTTALASGTFAANQSWVFEGNSNGTSWTLYTGQHVE